MSEQPSRRGGSGVGPAARRGAVGAPVEGRGAAGPAGRAAAAAPNAARRVLGGLRWSDHRIQQVQRRTLTTLVAAQALGGLASPSASRSPRSSPRRSSAPRTSPGSRRPCRCSAPRSLRSCWPISWASAAGGSGSAGYLLGATGAALCVVAGVVDSFAILLVGATLVGSTTAANNQSRYAATDLARPTRRARAPSLVVWATTVGAVAGPNLTGFAGEVGAGLGLPRLTGPFLFGVAGMLAAALVIGLLLRPDPLLVAREAAMDTEAVHPGARAASLTGTKWPRALEVVGASTKVSAGSRRWPWRTR